MFGGLVGIYLCINDFMANEEKMLAEGYIFPNKN